MEGIKGDEASEGKEVAEVEASDGSFWRELAGENVGRLHEKPLGRRDFLWIVTRGLKNNYKYFDLQRRSTTRCVYIHGECPLFYRKFLYTAQSYSLSIQVENTI